MRRGGKTFQLVSKGANIFHFNLSKGCRNALFQPKKSHNFELKPQPDHEKGSITCREMCYFILKYFKKIWGETPNPIKSKVFIIIHNI